MVSLPDALGNCVALFAPVFCVAFAFSVGALGGDGTLLGPPLPPTACDESTDGTFGAYRGCQNRTMSGKACVPWKDEYDRQIRERAISIWLKADSEIIMRRVRRRADRPLLQTADPEATVIRLLGEREPIYSNADLTIASRDVPHDRIVDECLEALHAHLCGVRPAEEPPSDGMNTTS